jgi:hypothetical protein
MTEIRILKTDLRGRITLPPSFRKEPLFEYVIKGDQLILYPIRTVRKYPDMSDLPKEELSPAWVKAEKKTNEREGRVQKRKFFEPPSGLKPQATAIASSRVDLPQPFSPIRKVTRGWRSSTSKCRTADKEKG